MDDSYVLMVIVVLTVATVIDRSALWLAGHHVNLPRRVQEALRFAPACALAAIIVPDLFLENNQMTWSLHNPKLWAGLVAGALYLWRRDMLLTIVAGMLVFTIFRLYF